MFDIISNIAFNNIIGIDGKLFIKSNKDLQFFKNKTESKQSKQNIVVMGYKTWISLPNSARPLPNRFNIVITTNHMYEFTHKKDVLSFITFNNFIEWIYKYNKDYNKIFIIGGESIYDEVFQNYKHLIDNVYITRTQIQNYEINNSLRYVNDKNTSKFNFDIWDDINNFKLIKSESQKDNGYVFFNNCYTNVDLILVFETYINVNNINKQEKQYLDLLKHILNKNNYKSSRNGNVYSMFGEKMTFDLRNSFPLLTTKKMPFKTILRELLWFISGSTNNNKLQEKNVKIWNKNAIEYNSKSNYKEGDLGPIYGFQWRHFGAEYCGCDENYKNKGIDQIKYIIDKIKTDPQSRRLILSSWNPIDIPNMALPPCHVMVQFYIDDIYIDAQLYQRSGDMFLGVPFNIASYSLLLSIVGKLTGYIPRYFHHILGDAHIYENHVTSVRQQLIRRPYMFPTLTINNSLTDIDLINETMFTLNNYNCYDVIKADMIV